MKCNLTCRIVFSAVVGVAAARTGRHAVLSVTGTVDGEPSFSAGKYEVARDGGTWYVEKPIGMRIFVR